MDLTHSNTESRSFPAGKGSAKYDHSTGNQSLPLSLFLTTGTGTVRTYFDG